MTVTWIGHATVLINFRGTTLLTDPVLVKRIPFHPFGIRRITELPLEYEDLPPIDIVLLSHAHHDHWDMASLRKFDGTPAVVIPAHTSDLVPEERFSDVVELDWDRSVTLEGLTIRAVEMEHWGERYASETQHRGYNGYVVTDGTYRIAFFGDTAHLGVVETEDGFHSDAIAWNQRFPDGPYDLCMIPIGEAEAFLSHMGPEQAWDVFQEIGGKLMMPIHWRTFILSQPSGDPLTEPLERLRAAAGDRQDRIVGAEPGTVVVLP